MEAVFWIIGAMGVGLCVWLLVRGIARSEVAADLCLALDRGDARKVRAILITYRHRLQKKQIEDAELWLIERDNEKANR